MSLRDRARSALYGAMTNSDGSPASARRATQGAAMLADTLADNGHHTAAVAASLAGAAAAAAEGALSVYIYPPGDYAGFNEKGSRR
ncbi:hypothetical protein ACIBCU_26390 [Streptomyces sp. NPDC051064]|uniref:hypothetical protein n=1 Tax=Streptomyces sp. NPDC051064 TaxID=3365641 RepID=UPI0037B88CBB